MKFSLLFLFILCSNLMAFDLAEDPNNVCSGAGIACDAEKVCCNGYICGPENKCVTPNGEICTLNGNLCSSNSDCCTGSVCNNSRCEPSSSGCKAEGELVGGSLQCCAGLRKVITTEIENIINSKLSELDIESDFNEPISFFIAELPANENIEASREADSSRLELSSDNAKKLPGVCLKEANAAATQIAHMPISGSEDMFSKGYVNGDACTNIWDQFLIRKGPNDAGDDVLKSFSCKQANEDEEAGLYQNTFCMNADYDDPAYGSGSCGIAHGACDFNSDCCSGVCKRPTGPNGEFTESDASIKECAPIKKCLHCTPEGESPRSAYVNCCDGLVYDGSKCMKPVVYPPVPDLSFPTGVDQACATHWDRLRNGRIPCDLSDPESCLLAKARNVELFLAAFEWLHQDTKDKKNDRGRKINYVDSHHLFRRARWVSERMLGARTVAEKEFVKKEIMLMYEALKFMKSSEELNTDENDALNYTQMPMFAKLSAEAYKTKYEILANHYTQFIDIQPYLTNGEFNSTFSDYYGYSGKDFSDLSDDIPDDLVTCTDVDSRYCKANMALIPMLIQNHNFGKYRRRTRNSDSETYKKRPRRCGHPGEDEDCLGTVINNIKNHYSCLGRNVEGTKFTDLRDEFEAVIADCSSNQSGSNCNSADWKWRYLIDPIIKTGLGGDAGKGAHFLNSWRNIAKRYTSGKYITSAYFYRCNKDDQFNQDKIVSAFKDKISSYISAPETFNSSLVSPESNQIMVWFEQARANPNYVYDDPSEDNAAFMAEVQKKADYLRGIEVPELNGILNYSSKQINYTPKTGKDFHYQGGAHANHVAVVDVDSRRVTDYLLVGKRPWGLALTRDETKLYVANGLSDDVSVIDVEALRVVKSVAVGFVPYGLLIDD